MLTAAERISVTKTAVLKTRPAKEHAPESVLHARWRHEAAQLGWDPTTVWRQIAEAAERIRRTPAGQDAPLGWLVAEVVTAAGRARAAFSRADLAIEVANRLPPAPAATAEQVRVAVQRLTDAGLARGGAVFLGAPRHGETTPTSPPSPWTMTITLARHPMRSRTRRRGTPRWLPGQCRR